MTELKGYSPLGAEAQAHISEAWKSYREVFGFEAEKAQEMRQAHASEILIGKRLGEDRKLRKELLPMWKEVWTTN